MYTDIKIVTEEQTPLVKTDAIKTDALHTLVAGRLVASKPLVNIAETADAFLIEVAAPGLSGPDFKISINGTLLSISFKSRKCAAGNKVYSQQEFKYCCFKKNISLPPHTDTFFISATYTDGILCIHLPKSTAPFMHRDDRIMVY